MYLLQLFVEFSFGKQYFLIKERKTFDDAIQLCKSRNEQLVQINSEIENNFIFKTVAQPSTSDIWLGAENIVGTATFKWLVEDGGEHSITNWENGDPNEPTGQRNAITMNKYFNGKYRDSNVHDTNFVLCQSVSASKFELIQQANQFNATIKQLDNRLVAYIKSAIQESQEHTFADIDNKLESLSNELGSNQVAAENKLNDFIKIYKNDQKAKNATTLTWIG